MIAVASSASVDFNSTTIPKPTGLAVGDLMVAFVTQAGSYGSITPPSGFTQIRETQDADSGGRQMNSYYKIADSGDVAASNFAFTRGGTPTNYSGGMVRIAAGLFDATTPIATSNGVSVEGAASINDSCSVTPTLGSSLLLIFVGTDGNSGENDVSGYAVQNSDPGTWVEAFEQADTGVQMSCAYAVRAQVTATGNVSMTGGDAGSDWAIQVIVVNPYQIVVSESVTATDSVLIDTTLNVSDTVTVTDEVAAAAARQWTNDTKNSSSWSNDTKH